jgi:O-antigen ligase
MQANGSNEARPGAPGFFDAQRMALRMHQTQRYLAIALGFSIPLSTALDNVLSAVILLLWLVSGGYAQKLHVIRNNPVAMAALVLFALTLVGLIWSIGPIEDGLLFVRKYSNLLLIPILVTIFTDAEDRKLALLAFAAALIVSLVASYALAFGVVSHNAVIIGWSYDPSAFKSRIAHNILMAYGCLLFAELARSMNGRERWIWAALAALALVNVMLMVKGRTGYVVLAGLVLLWISGRFRWKGLVAALVLVAAGFAVSYQFSHDFRFRVDLTTKEAEQWRPNVATDTSVGQRLEFYRNTLEIVKRQPLLGVGTGGFFKAYEDQVQGTQMAPTRNPHNLYLLVLVQFGILGLVLLVGFFFAQWRCAWRLGSRSDLVLAQAVVVTIALGGLFNSMLIDHTESMFLAWMSGLLYGGLRQSV